MKENLHDRKYFTPLSRLYYKYSKKDKTVLPKNSSISELNLELKLIQQQEELVGEERQEKLKATQEKFKAIEKRRENVLKEIEIQRKIMQKSTSSADIETLSSTDLYQDPVFMNNWVEDTKKCIYTMKYISVNAQYFDSLDICERSSSRLTFEHPKYSPVVRG
ncbi:hypothetical protein JTB14_033993 [Gonioctena quinquepunctata]|nr:hypothetical protein JTB14_033993 [Gonioctena quinquepunctata]